MKKIFLFVVFSIASFTCFAQANKPVLGYFSLDTAGTNKKSPDLKKAEMKAFSNDKDGGNNPNNTNSKENTPKLEPMEKTTAPKEKDKPK